MGGCMLPSRPSAFALTQAVSALDPCHSLAPEVDADCPPFPLDAGPQIAKCLTVLLDKKASIFMNSVYVMSFAGLRGFDDMCMGDMEGPV